MISVPPSKRASSLVAIAAAIGAVLAAPPARGDSAQTNEVAAEALFLEAKALLRDGDAAAACPKLAESHRLDPGTGTLLMLALCHERVGRNATAWSEFRESLTRARAEQRADREELARRHIAALEPRLAHVKVVVPDDDASLPGFEVKSDGEVLTATAGTTSIPVDPGSHVIEAFSKGERVWSIEVVIGSEPEDHEVTVPRLLARPVIAASEPPPARAPKVAALPPSWPPPEHESHPLRPLAIGAGVIALAGVVVGAVYGARAIQQSNESKRLCPSYPCAAGAADANDAARSAATISNVAFAAGGAAALGAITLVILDRPSSPGASVAGAAVGWRTSW